MIFHLAIPAENIAESRTFYAKIGAEFGRATSDMQIMKLWNAQIVLHKSPSEPADSPFYPRHFGVIVGSREYLDFAELLENAAIEYKAWRRNIQHSTITFRDPSNNWLEVKTYNISEAIFGHG